MNNIYQPSRVLHRKNIVDESLSFTPHRSLHRTSGLLSLEQRFMFDAAAVATAAEATKVHADVHVVALIVDTPPPTQVREVDTSLNNGKKEVVFIDTSVIDYKTLENGIHAGVEIQEINQGQNGLAQIAKWAESHSNYDAIHIMSHGSEGALHLGATLLTDASLVSLAVQTQLADIGRALTTEGDLLLYGCDVAAGNDGQRFVAGLAAATGADVAASTDVTGRGGDWTLEARVGEVDSHALEIDDYQGLLTTVTITGTDADYSATSFTKSVGGRTLTFSNASNNLGTDTTYGAGTPGLYAYEGSVNGSDIKLTIAIENGYTFDISSFMTGAASGQVEMRVTYANNSTETFEKTGLNHSWQTLSSFTSASTTISDIKQIVLTSTDFALFQDFDITDVKAVVAAPTVTDVKISITSTGSGTGGAYKIGDTVTASWNNTGTGDNNAGITGVTMDFSQFSGGAAVAATESSGTWTASYTIVSGAIDGANKNVSVTATNGSATTRADTTNLTVDNVPPTVTDGRISISGANGTGGAYKIGDTVTATWNNTAGGDNNSDTISGVTMDFSAFGGGSAVSASNSSGTWTATYAIVSGAIDGTNKNVSVTATDNAGNTTTRADTTNATVDNVAPAVTDAKISISGANGTGGAYKIGDTVTATWNNTAGGDNNTDTISGVTVDFSQFGGGAAVAATNSSGTWTATYTIAAGAINGTTNRNVSVTATDNAGNATTTADTSNATADNVTPTTTISTAAFSADTGASNTDFITKTAAQTISGTASTNIAAGEIVEVSLNNGSTWNTATSTVGSNAWSYATTLSASNTLKVRVTDAAGNGGTALSQAFVLNTTAPTTTISTTAFSADTGASSTDFITQTAAQTISGTTSANIVAGEIVEVSLDNGSTWTTATSSVGQNTWSLAGQTLAASDTLKVRVTDTAGNNGTALSQAYVLDTTAPTTTISTAAFSADTGTSSTDFLTKTAAQTISGTTSANIVAGEIVEVSLDNGSTWTTATSSVGQNTWSLVGQTLTSSNTLKIRVSDAAGNNGTIFSQAYVLDTTTPTITFSSLLLSADTGPSNSDFITNTASQTVNATLSGAPAGSDVVYGSLDNGATWIDITNKVSGTTLTWNGVTLTSSNTLMLKVTDTVGNDGAATSQAYTLDTAAPSAPSTPDMTNGTDTGTSNTDNITNNTTPTFTGTAESGSTVTLYDTDGTTVLGTATATGGNWSITSSTLSAGSHTVTTKATDVAGNVGSASSGLAITIDTTAPTGVGLDNTTIPTLSATSTVTIATLSSTDGLAVTYSLAVGNGTNDADNGSFIISGTSLKVGGSSLTAGTYHIYVAATDAAGNVANQSFTLTIVDAPSITSIVRAGGASATVNTASTSVSYTVTFSEAVTGVDGTDFSLTATGTASGNIASISGSGTTYTVVVDTISGDGTLRLDLKNSGTGIQNGSSVNIASGYTSGATYTFDHTAPSTPSAPDMTIGTDTGVSSTDNVTSNTTPTFTGTAENNSTVTLYDTDGTTVLGTTTATGGNWSITSSTLSAGSHTITAKANDAAGNIGSASSALSVTIDTSGPTVSSVAVPSNGSYKSGDNLSFTVNANEAITIDTTGGTPRLALTVGGSTVYANYVSGSGGTALVFSYTVQGGDSDVDGIAVGTLQANGGTLKDAAGNNMALTLNSIGSTAAVLVDTISPTVNSVSVPANTSYGIGQYLDFTVNFSEAVTVTGTPNIGLVIGATSVQADYVSGSGSTALLFRHTVLPGQNDVDGIAVGALALNSGAVRDTAGNNATLTLNSVGNTTSVLVDTFAPIITFSNLAFSADTGIGSTDFITKTANQNITATLSGAPAGGDIVYGSLDNGVTWTDITNKVAGTTLTWNGVILTDSSTLKLKVTDIANNDGAITSQAYTLDTVATAPIVNALAAMSTTPMLTGTAELTAGESLTIAVGGATYNVTPTAGNWSLDLSSAIPASGSLVLVLGNSYAVTATVMDVAGNSTSASNTLSLVTQPTAPVLPLQPDILSSFVNTPIVSLPESIPNTTAITFLSASTDSVVGNSITNVASINSSVRIGNSPINVVPTVDRLPISTNLTSSGSGQFPIMVIGNSSSSGSESLVLNKSMTDQVVQSTGQAVIIIPPDVFAHSDPQAIIRLSVRQADGRPLPNWVSFDAEKGKFDIKAPKGFVGELPVRITARDSQGHEVTTIFKIRVGAPVGRSSLSEQIHLATAERLKLSNAFEHFAQSSTRSLND